MPLYIVREPDGEYLLCDQLPKLRRSGGWAIPLGSLWKAGFGQSIKRAFQGIKLEPGGGPLEVVLRPKGDVDAVPVEIAERASKLLATIDRELPRWRAWFPNEGSHVEVPRADLLVFAEIVRSVLSQRPAGKGVGE